MVRKEKLHPRLLEPVEFNHGQGEIRAESLLSTIPENNVPLANLANRHIVTAWQFDRDLIVQLARLAATYEKNPVLFHHPLAGKILISAFYEPSTRTRLSFESAWHRLGGDIMSITDANTTGIAKGESLEDVAEMFNNYGDVVVLRDTSSQAVYRMLDSLRIPILNAGNGIDEHPTQALADLYAILKWRPELGLETVDQKRKVRIGIIGTPGKMRTVRSLCIMLSFFHAAISELIVINPDEEIFDEGQKEELEQMGLNISRSSDLNPILPELDVIYINSIAWIGESFQKLAGEMRLKPSSPLKKDAIILHPLARSDELDPGLDQTTHNRYFDQARGAVFIRMALLTCLVQRVSLVTNIEDPTLDLDGK